MATITQVKRKKGYTFKVDIRVKGYKRILKYFNDTDIKTARTLARQWASDVELQMQKGIYREESTPIIEEDKKLETIKDLILYFKENECPHRYQHHEKYFFIYDWWIDKIGELKPAQLTPAILSNCKYTLANEELAKPLKGKTTRSNSTINKYLFALSAIIEFGIDEFALWEYNPMSRVKKRKKDKITSLRARFLQEDEIEKVKEKAQQKTFRFYVFVMIALVTGARFSIVLHLQEKDINFKTKEIYLLYNKARNNIGFPVGDELLDLIAKLIQEEELHEGYLFWDKRINNFYNYKGWFESIIKEAGIKDFRFHDLRHTAATYYLMNGASETALMELFGWTSREMIKRYSHLTRKHTRELVEKTSSVFI